MDIDPTAYRRFAWFIAFLLFAGSVVNYIDRAALAYVMPQVRRELSLTNTDYGLVVNVFLVTYTLFYILGGRLADRLGCRRSFTITVVFWSMASMAHGLVRGFRSLFVCRALLGMWEGGYYPAAMRGAAEWFPSAYRAKAVGLLLSAISVGMSLAPPAVAWITLNYGWRVSFLVTGTLGLLLVPPWLSLHRRIRQRFGVHDPAPADTLDQRARPPGEEEPPLFEVLKTRKYWCILTARAAPDAAWYFYLFWIPAYFQEVRHLDLAMVGRLLWIPYVIAGVGALGGAWASSALIRRGFSLDRSRKSILFASAFLCVVGASACFASGPYFAVALVSFALFGHQSWSSNIHTVITEITPGKHVAVLYGITGAAGTLLGAVSQPVIGAVVDRAGYKPAFVAAGLAYVAGATLVAAAGKIERIRRNATASVALPK
jgi:ACS family hexuronate transporter-like MFS transporter